ncbi:Spore photoproduct lyase [Caldisalinibacter kiritimatiensis]|uniref:Spore photoproduct lyase n=1 Tax=Caldisalinibacter kiritimatiensis TaxID=1304284 RepID=R1CFV5_9FIRM|nr:Spore photoproduct lyase [Caldisalinibacter kiritimatiensis]
MSKFKDAIKIEIDHYKDVFSRGHQSFVLQKNSPKLILAVKEDNLVYKGAEVCEDFGNQHFYYTSSIMNCIYNCEYCYLQGMYSSANVVVFVNIEDIFNEIEKLLEKHPVYLSISYETDLLAFEGLTSYTSKWMEFASKHSDLKLELRTKSANFNAISHIKPLNNVILAWTISPDKVIVQYEKGTPSLDNRLKSVRSAMDKGWKVRLCFDPLLYIKEWRKHYSKCIDKTFDVVPVEQIHDISIGVFRVSKDYLKRIKKERTNSMLLAYPFECKNGVCSYTKEHTEQMINFVYNKVNKYVTKEKIYI